MNDDQEPKRYLDKQGYVRIGSEREHRMVMERVMGRPLISGVEKVHHKNGIRHDNRPENLELWTAEHPHGTRNGDLEEWAVSFLREKGYTVGRKFVL